MINTLKAKKGVHGWTLTPWNFHGGRTHRNDDGSWAEPDWLVGSFDIHSKRDGFRTEVRYIARPVGVHSSGKKQMYLIALDKGGEMRKEKYCADTIIYATKEDAEKAAVEAFPRVVECTVESTERLLRQHMDHKDSYGDKPWFNSETEVLNECIRIAKAGELTMKVITYTEWKEELNA